MNIISSHPKITPEKLAELAVLREKIDREEKDEIIALGREFFARQDRIKATMARIKAARESKQLTLEQVSKKTGIDSETISTLETEANPNPTINTLLRIADAVGVDVLR